MYCIYLKENGNKTVIYIEGKLDSVNELTRLISEVSRQNNLQEESVILDLAKTESISEECMEKLQNFKSVYNLQFLNYSLYIETQLQRHNLLIMNQSEADKTH